MKKIARIILVILGLIIIYFSIKLNSTLSKNTFDLENKLMKNDISIGLIKNFIDFDYDFIHIFSSNQTKEEMERQIGFNHFNLKESNGDDVVNILFVKNKKPVAYIYGRTIEKGYYLEIDYEKAPFVIKKEEADKFQYNMKKMEEENPSYNKYFFEKYK